MIKAAVLGYPIHHSLSPIIHNYWLQQYHIQGSYEKIALDAQEFRDFMLHEGKSYAGFNVTLPYKEEVIPYLDDVSPLAQRIGAVNTVMRKDGLYYGDNSDAFGFWENIKTQIKSTNHALIIGAGGASRAIIVALQDAGFTHITITNRHMEKAEKLAKEFNINAQEFAQISWHALDLIVNCTSLGMMGTNSELILDFTHIAPNCFIADIVYQPLMTRLLQDAHAHNIAYETGIGMLLHQARLGFSYWFNHMPQVTPALESEILRHVQT